MLSTDHKAIVRATVPLLEAGGEALTTHFYGILLSEHPEVRPYFNQANQLTGEQPRALANGVLMYARHIDQLEALGDLVSVIVNKHVSLRIRREHYPIVGACLAGFCYSWLARETGEPVVGETEPATRS